jgi:hypothetical protein
VQLDGSDHNWVEGRGPRLTLLLAVDDATSTIPYAQFSEQEDTRSYFLLARGIIQPRGIPQAAYSNCHGVFQTPFIGRRPARDQKPTQFGRAMGELGIQQVFARSPEAKGRVERAAGTPRPNWWLNCAWPASPQSRGPIRSSGTSYPLQPPVRRSPCGASQRLPPGCSGP